MKMPKIRMPQYKILNKIPKYLKPKYIFNCACLLLLMSCHLPLNEKPLNQKITVNSFESTTQCFDNFGTSLKRFADGAGSDLELNESWNCLKKAIATFEDSTRGEQVDSYQAKEISNFVETYYLDLNQKISESLIQEIFRIKFALVGGATNSITRSEIEQIESKIDRLNKITQNINPDMTFLVQKWTPSPDENANIETFQLIQKHFVDAAQEVGSLFEHPYDLNGLVALESEISLLLKNKSSQVDMLKKASKYIPLVVQFKKVLFADNSSLIGSIPLDNSPHYPVPTTNKWKDFFSSGATIYFKYLFFSYFVNKSDLLHASSLRYLDFFFDDVGFFLESLIKRRSADAYLHSDHLRTDELIAFAPFLKTAGLLPEKLSAEALQNVMKMFIEKILVAPERRLAEPVPSGLSLSSLSNLRQEFTRWLTVQRFIIWAYQEGPSIQGQSGPELTSLAKNYIENHPDLAQPDLPQPQTDAFAELTVMFDNPIGISFTPEKRLHIGKPGLPYLESTISSLNLVRMGCRLLIRSYGQDLQRILNMSNNGGGLTFDEFATAIADLSPLLNDMEWVDPKNTQFGPNRFRDGTLFTAWSNGDKLLDYKEAVGLGMMLLSGIEIDSKLFSEVEKKCSVDKTLAPSYDWKIPYRCVTDSYLAVQIPYFNAMPGMAQYLQNISGSDNFEILENFLKASGAFPDSSGNILHGYLSQYPHVVQYAENFFLRFDPNNDSIVDTAEAMVAYPVFKEIMRAAANGQLSTDKQLKALFAWILVYGATPKPNEFARFTLAWVPKGEKGWNIRADRKKIAVILGYLASSLPPKVMN